MYVELALEFVVGVSRNDDVIDRQPERISASSCSASLSASVSACASSSGGTSGHCSAQLVLLDTRHLGPPVDVLPFDTRIRLQPRFKALSEHLQMRNRLFLSHMHASCHSLCMAASDPTGNSN